MMQFLQSFFKCQKDYKFLTPQENYNTFYKGLNMMPGTKWVLVRQSYRRAVLQCRKECTYIFFGYSSIYFCFLLSILVPLHCFFKDPELFLTLGPIQLKQLFRLEGKKSYQSFMTDIKCTFSGATQTASCHFPFGP